MCGRIEDQHPCRLSPMHRGSRAPRRRRVDEVACGRREAVIANREVDLALGYEVGLVPVWVCGGGPESSGNVTSISDQALLVACASQRNLTWAPRTWRGSTSWLFTI